MQSADFRLLTPGPWAHVDPPTTLPAWIGCDGFTGVLAYSHRARPSTARPSDTHLLVRASRFPTRRDPGYAVVVDLLVNDAIRQQLRKETGVELKSVTAVPRRERTRTRGRWPAAPAATTDAAALPATPGLLSSLTSFIDYRDWATGAPGPLSVTSALSVAELYDRISAAEGSVGRTFGQGLLLVLFVIGALFLIIEAMALIAGFALAKSLTGSVHELFTGTERVRQGDFTHKIAVRSEDQLGELAESFNSMTASIEDLLRQAAEKKRLEEELRIAHEIQMSLLPQGPLRDGRAVGDRALRPGARSGRRLLRLPAARRSSRRRADRRRVGQGHVGGALHGGAEGAGAVAQRDPHLAARRC